MKKILFIISIISALACAPNNEVDCLECRNWKVIQVKENNVVVYSSGGSSLYPAYTDFKFNLMKDNRKVLFKDIIGVEFNGVWGINDQKTQLMLSNLTPLLYGTENQLIFDILSMAETSLVLKSTTVNPKTGNTINEYTFMPY